MFGSVSKKDIVNSLAEKNINILKNEIDLNKSIKNLTYEKVSINLHPEVSCDITLNVARSLEEASTQKQLGKAVTSNSENVDVVGEVSQELLLQNETATEEKKDKIIQTDGLSVTDIKESSQNIDTDNKIEISDTDN